MRNDGAIVALTVKPKDLFQNLFFGKYLSRISG